MSQFISFTAPDRSLSKSEIDRVEKFYYFFLGMPMTIVPKTVRSLKSVLRESLENGLMWRLRDQDEVLKKHIVKMKKSRIENCFVDGLDDLEVSKVKLPRKVYRTFLWMLQVLEIDLIDYLSKLGIHSEIVRTKGGKLSLTWSFQSPRFSLQHLHEHQELISDLTLGERNWIADMADRNWYREDAGILLDLWMAVDRYHDSQAKLAHTDVVSELKPLRSTSFDHVDTIDGMLDRMDEVHTANLASEEHLDEESSEEIVTQKYGLGPIADIYQDLIDAGFMILTISDSDDAEDTLTAEG